MLNRTAQRETSKSESWTALPFASSRSDGQARIQRRCAPDYFVSPSAQYLLPKDHALGIDKVLVGTKGNGWIAG